MALNLRGAQQAFRRLLLVDACRITLPGARVWNETTGVYSSPAGTTLYEGECQFSAINSFPMEQIEGGDPRILTNYELKIPVDVEVRIPVEAEVQCISVHDGGDQLLVNQWFITDAEGEVSTYGLSRKIRVRRRESRPT